MAVIDFYFDYLSPYAYLASLEIPRVCERHGAELRLHPVLFAGLLGHWGQLGPAEIPPKGRHAMRECRRYAALHDIPLRSPVYHPFNPLTALRASLAEVAGDGQGLAMLAIFDLGWRSGGDMGDSSQIASALDTAGLDGKKLVGRTHEPEIKELLRRETEEAVERDVFGIPTMIAGDELFWGLDQIRYLELHLEGRDPLGSVRSDQMGTRGPSAWRRGIRRTRES